MGSVYDSNAEHGIGEQISNSRLVCSVYFGANAFEKAMNLSLPPVMG